MAHSGLHVPDHIRCLIFDCDGTLVDTMPVHNEAWVIAFERIGKTCPMDFIHGLNGMTTTTIVVLMNQKYSFGIDVEPFAVMKEEIANSNLHKAEPIAPVVALARQYHTVLPMAVASGGVRANVDKALQAADLLNHFDIVLTADDPIAPKPAPDLFLAIAKRLRVEPEHCQVFEDGEAGLEAARKAGMLATDVRPFLGSAT